MSIEKMREDFESAVRREFSAAGICEADLRRDAKGQYLADVHVSAWWAWQTVYKRLNEAEKLLHGVHTGDLFGPDDWETVNTFLNGSPAPKICECGPLRNITEGGHFPACTRCHRRLRP